MHEKNPAEVEKKIEQFVYEALAFNKKHNIFVRESIKEVYEKDVDDCLPVLQKINNTDKILDLGSGGGFPGIVIAIVKPMCEIHLLEKSKKKCYFLNKTIDFLGLKNAKVLNTVISKNNNLGPYTLITARAFSSTTNILELTQNNLCEGGKYVLLKGKKEKITEELATIDTNKYKYEIIKLENKKYERHLVEIKKGE
jgi:16S rRNA (guanine527-N7)-methyltransferase